MLHSGLTSQDPNTLYSLVRLTGSRFSLPALPGYSALLFDYLAAANTIISSGLQDQVIGGLLKTEDSWVV